MSSNHKEYLKRRIKEYEGLVEKYEQTRERHRVQVHYHLDQVIIAAQNAMSSDQHLDSLRDEMRNMYGTDN